MFSVVFVAYKMDRVSVNYNYRNKSKGNGVPHLRLNVLPAKSSGTMCAH